MVLLACEVGRYMRKCIVLVNVLNGRRYVAADAADMIREQFPFHCDLALEDVPHNTWAAARQLAAFALTAAAAVALIAASFE